MNPEAFIDEDIIHHLLKGTIKSPNEEIQKILGKALLLKGLELDEVAALINLSGKDGLDSLFKTALKIKKLVYGNRLVLFAPLYISSYCSNNCLYCGFRKDNKGMKRKCLTIDEIKEETKMVLEQGHKRILMLMGENSAECSFEYFLKAIDAVYSVKDSKGNSIRRINAEIAPLSEEEFRKLSKIKIGTYACFQETYHKETYRKMHPSGRKADYFWRIYAMDRALKNGLHDVGIGALFGLYDYRFEVLALIQHAKHLNKTYGIGPHTISIPRIEPAQNAPISQKIPYPVSDFDFKKLVAVLRCAVPYTGMILSTRETAEMRNELFNLGVSQISAGSKTNPGGYKESITNPINEEQFSINDTRTTGEVIKSVIEQGFIPSFCTGCYRKNRVGKEFMELAKPGLIKMHCLPNSLTTLKEYLMDYADVKTKEMGEHLIEKELTNIPEKIREKTANFLKRIENGERDLYF